MDFDIIPFEDITWGPRLGAGSFGSVYRGSYLGIDIAIKEVLPSTEYDVHKYFEREWRIMRECRHPNIVLFLGLSKAAGDDGRVFIISEYVPRGNLRQYILSTHPFPWRLRLSFATDVARAVAYLHARQCIHRDLKGENLLVTSNERIKVTDFGFARITSRNADEARRMTYCGTDGYMSPEIINGLSFDLPTDVFSLGMIFIEILSRRLVDSKTYTREAPDFTPDPSEVHRRASPGCPAALIDLALACVQAEPHLRPLMPDVLARLREIELDVLARPETGAEHVGSVRLVARAGPRAMPVFAAPAPAPDAPKLDTAGPGSRIGGALDQAMAERVDDGRDSDDDDAIRALELTVDGSGATEARETWRTARWDQASVTTSVESERQGAQLLLATSDTADSFGSSAPSYSSLYPPLRTASALRSAEPAPDGADDPASVLTVRAAPANPSPQASEEQTTVTVAAVAPSVLGPSRLVNAPSEIHTTPSLSSELKPALAATAVDRSQNALPKQSGIDMQPTPPAAATATQVVSPPAPVPAVPTTGALGTHRFSLVTKEPPAHGRKVSSAFATNLAKALLPHFGARDRDRDRCAICQKRVGRAALQCDDCGMTVHVRCSHAAPRNCNPDNHK